MNRTAARAAYRKATVSFFAAATPRERNAARPAWTAAEQAARAAGVNVAAVNAEVQKELAARPAARTILVAN